MKSKQNLKKKPGTTVHPYNYHYYYSLSPLLRILPLIEIALLIVLLTENIINRERSAHVFCGQNVNKEKLPASKADIFCVLF
jgi:hypothetical protein